MAGRPGDGRMNLAALTPEELARLLTANGETEVTPERIRGAIADGAPTNPDGTINLVHYTAWLVRELTGRGD